MVSTVYEAFAATTAAHPNNAFLCVPSRSGRDWLPQGLELTFDQVTSEVEYLRERLARSGFGHGHRVALLLENRSEFFFYYLALNALGISIVPINPDYRHDEMVYLLDHSEAVAAFVLPHRREDVQRAAMECRQPLPVVDINASPANFPVPCTPAPQTGGSNSASECALLYTSGTTGRPKGCMLSNFYFLTAGSGYRDLGGLIAIRHGTDRIYNPLPLFHINNLSIASTCAILTANCLILPERFSPSRWWSEVVATRATIIHYLGVVAPMLLNQPKSADEKRHCVRFGIGAGVEPLLHAQFEQRFGFPLVEI
jgi:acyl-CoA synthetase (AMP-forming)/AMP-acid ligase II